MIVGHSTWTVWGAESATVAVPAGTQVGDLLVFSISTRYAHYAADAGWTWLVQNKFQSTSVSRLNTSIMYRVVTDPVDDLYTFTTTAANNGGYGVLIAFRNFAFLELSPENEGISSTPTALSLEAAGAGILLAIAANTLTDAHPYTAPAGMTLVSSGKGGSGTLGASHAVAQKAQAAGTTGNQTFGSSASDDQHAWSLMVYTDVPTLSLPAMTDVVAASARPKVTLGY